LHFFHQTDIVPPERDPAFAGSRHPPSGGGLPDVMRRGINKIGAAIRILSWPNGNALNRQNAVPVCKMMSVVF
jgi:hypothetical protein